MLRKDPGKKRLLRMILRKLSAEKLNKIQNFE
jgi:hypothetical protein